MGRIKVKEGKEVMEIGRERENVMKMMDVGRRKKMQGQERRSKERIMEGKDEGGKESRETSNGGRCKEG